MKRLMLGVVLAVFSASSFADYDIDIKRTAKNVCKNSDIKAQTACEKYVNISIAKAFSTGKLVGVCEYEIQLSKSQEVIQDCKKALSESDIQQYYALEEEFQTKF